MDSHELNMEEYYEQRAPVYDEIYSYPERQDNLRFLESYVENRFFNKRVLEIAAGTGYRTQFIAERALSVLATDINESPIQQIKNRPNASKIKTQVVDAYKLESIESGFDALYSGLWISHIPRQNLPAFIENSLSKLEKNSFVTFIDNSVAQCQHYPITHKDNFGNTYQDRVLPNNDAYSVLKNFPTEQELHQLVAGLGTKANYIHLEHFWLFSFETL